MRKYLALCETDALNVIIHYFAGDSNFSRFDSRVSVLTLIVAVRQSLGKYRRQVTRGQGVSSTLVPHNTTQHLPASQHTGMNLLEAKHWPQTV